MTAAPDLSTPQRAVLPPAPADQHEGVQLRARGTQIALSNGEVWPLRYGLDALVELEDLYGSMDALNERFQEITRMPNSPGLMRALRDVLVPGLLEAAEDRGVDPGRISRLLDISQVGAYMEAFQQAIAQAFPQSDAPPATGPGSPPAVKAGRGNGGSPSRSRGASGTTSRPSGSGAAKRSSGG